MKGLTEGPQPPLLLHESKLRIAGNAGLGLAFAGSGVYHRQLR